MDSRVVPVLAVVTIDKTLIRPSMQERSLKFPWHRGPYVRMLRRDFGGSEARRRLLSINKEQRIPTSTSRSYDDSLLKPVTKPPSPFPPYVPRIVAALTVIQPKPRGLRIEFVSRLNRHSVPSLRPSLIYSSKKPQVLSD